MPQNKTTTIDTSKMPVIMDQHYNKDMNSQFLNIEKNTNTPNNKCNLEPENALKKSVLALSCFATSAAVMPFLPTVQRISVFSFSDRRKIKFLDNPVVWLTRKYAPNFEKWRRQYAYKNILKGNIWQKKLRAFHLDAIGNVKGPTACNPILASRLFYGNNIASNLGLLYSGHSHDNQQRISSAYAYMGANVVAFLASSHSNEASRFGLNLFANLFKMVAATAQIFAAFHDVKRDKNNNIVLNADGKPIYEVRYSECGKGIIQLMRDILMTSQNLKSNGFLGYSTDKFNSTKSLITKLGHIMGIFVGSDALETHITSSADAGKYFSAFCQVNGKEYGGHSSTISHSTPKEAKTAILASWNQYSKFGKFKQIALGVGLIAAAGYGLWKGIIEPRFYPKSKTTSPKPNNVQPKVTPIVHNTMPQFLIENVQTHVSDSLNMSAKDNSPQNELALDISNIILPKQKKRHVHKIDVSNAETYSVKAGDSLSLIASAYHISLNELLAANPQFAGRDINLINIEDQIQLPETYKSKPNYNTAPIDTSVVSIKLNNIKFQPIDSLLNK